MKRFKDIKAGQRLNIRGYNYLVITRASRTVRKPGEMEYNIASLESGEVYFVDFVSMTELHHKLDLEHAELV